MLFAIIFSISFILMAIHWYYFNLAILIGFDLILVRKIIVAGGAIDGNA